jgi:uncharacterized membrane protein YeaQ/YmgE (transglycosylase-associated protein family)
MEDVTLQTLLIYIGIGAILGLLLGTMLKRGGFGWFGNLCLGILGAFAGGLAATFGNIVVDNNISMNAMAAAAGAILLTLVVAIFKRS